MFVFISHLCQQEAKTYGIEDKLEQISEWVKQFNYQEFIEFFEIFTHPYYVRKGIAYSYRLLVKMLDITIDDKQHQVVVFFRLFHRRSKEYEALFHKADQHGDFFYQQQNLDHEVMNFLTDLLKNQHNPDQSNQKIINHSDSSAYFLQIKTNLLSFKEYSINSEYYQENPSWIYGIRPFVTADDLENTFENIQISLENEQTQQFSIKNFQVSFLPPPQLLLSSPNDSLDEPFARKLPTDVVLDKRNWLLNQQHRLPFYLNNFSKQVFDKIFNDTHSFPLIVNAPANQGKTSTLAMLASHYLLQPIQLNNLPFLLLCDSQDKERLRKEIKIYCQYFIKNQQLHEDVEIMKNIDYCCVDLPDLLRFYDTHLVQKFDKNLFIDNHKFASLWKKAPFIKNHQLKDIPVDLAWFVIQHIIKGELGIVGTGKLLSQTLDNYTVLSQETYQIIYQKVWLEWYKPMMDNGSWDLQDAFLFLSSLDNLFKFSAILIDNAHNYSKIALQFLVKHSLWWQDTEFFPQAPIIFMGNQYASLPQQLFSWQDETMSLLNRVYQTQVPNGFVQVQTIDYQADFISNIHFALQMQRQKTNLIKFQSAIHSQTKVIHSNIYFVNVSDRQLVSALINNQQIMMIANTYQKNLVNFLRHNCQIRYLFEYIDDVQLDCDFYTLDNLPGKSYQVALLGFCHSQDFAEFAKDDKDFAFLPFTRRYQLDMLLNLVRQVSQQSLKQLFIIGDDADFESWQQLLCTVLGQYCLQVPSMNMVNPQYVQESQDLWQRREVALAENSAVDIFDVASAYLSRYEYQEWFYLFLKVCEITQDYELYFDWVMNDNQKYLTFEYLWQQQNVNVLLKYADFRPKALKANIFALKLVYGELLSTPITSAFVASFEQYQHQSQDPVFAEFWQVLFPQLLKTLVSLKDSNINWLLILDSLHQLIDSGCDVPVDVLAMCYYQHNQVDTALQYWQIAEQTLENPHLPRVYYQLLLQAASDWQETLIPLIQLNKLGELMNTLSIHDLNELQLSYWDKILPYLEEDDELEPVLLFLLPKIQNQEILEKIYQYCQYDTVMSDNFMLRLQRLKTLQACLNGDWHVVIERLQHYVPVQDTDDMLSKLSQVFTTKKNMRGPHHSQTTVLRNKPPKPQDEVVDILYALNLNQDLYLSHDIDEFIVYSEQSHIKEIFVLIRKILAIKTDNDFEGILWNTEFPAVRSLAYLLEKSDNLMDALAVYGNIVHFSSNKNLKMFAIERIYVLLERAKQFSITKLEREADNEENVENLNQVQLMIQYMEKEFGKALKTVASSELATELPVLKTVEELVKSILALTDKEHKEVQRLEQEQRNFIKAQQAEAERLAKEAQQKAEEQEKLEKALLAKKAEQERLEREKLEQEQQRLEQERLEKEQEQQHLEQECLEKEQEQQRLEQECLEKVYAEQAVLEKQHSATVQEQIIPVVISEQPTVELSSDVLPEIQDFNPSLSEGNYQQNSSIKFSPLSTPLIKATSELQFFNWRIFVSRTYQRINIEDIGTGQRCSLYLADGVLQSDWQYQQVNGCYHFTQLPLMIEIVGQKVQLHHLEQGIDLVVY